MKVLFTLSMLVLVTAAAVGSVGDALNVSVVGRNADEPAPLWPCRPGWSSMGGGASSRFSTAPRGCGSDASRCRGSS